LTLVGKIVIIPIQVSKVYVPTSVIWQGGFFVFNYLKPYD
jgi:hypothetical protein